MKRARNGRAAGMITSAAIAVALAGGSPAGAALDPIGKVTPIPPTALPSPIASVLNGIDTPDPSPSGAVPSDGVLDTVGETVDGVVGTVEGVTGAAKDAVGSVGGAVHSADGEEGSPGEAEGRGKGSNDEPSEPGIGVSDGTKSSAGPNSGISGSGAHAAGDPARKSIGAYVAAASRAAAAAARRIVDLTGPFGAPLALTIFILMAFLAVGTGKDTLVRVENLAHKRVYRL